MKVRYILMATGLLGLAACSSSNNTVGTESLGSAIGSARTALQSALPTQNSSSILSLKTGEVTIQGVEDFSTTITDLGRPGGSCGGGNQNFSPREYFTFVMDPEFDCDDFAPTVFARFNEEVKVIELLSNDIPSSAGRMTVGEHSIQRDNVMQDGDSFSATATVSNLTSDHYDNRLVINGTLTMGEESMQIRAEVYTKFRNGQTHLKMYEDCRVQVGPCEQTTLGFSEFRHDSNTGALLYQYVAVQPGGSELEVQRIFRAPSSIQTYLMHLYTAGGLDNSVVDGRMKKVLVHGPQGRDSTSLSISVDMGNGTPGERYQRELCIDDEFVAQSAGACAGHDNAVAVGDVQLGAHWDNRNELFNLAIGANPENIAAPFNSVATFMDVYNAANP